ncbi:MAG: hypothetical protein AAGJ97_10260 [Planctomycetota bacterium]
MRSGWLAGGVLTVAVLATGGETGAGEDSAGLVSTASEEQADPAFLPARVDPTNPWRQIYHLCEPDGTVIGPLSTEPLLYETYDRHGSASYSADGTRLAIDAWSSANQRDFTTGRILVMNPDGTGAVDICDGNIPSLSPGGSRIAVSRYKQPDCGFNSVWVMNADGSDKTLLDPYGWSAQWSPDGRMIAYHGGSRTCESENEFEVNGRNYGRLAIYDVVEQTYREVFSSLESPFSSLYWNFDWAPDSRRIAVQGSLAGGQRIVAIIDVEAGVEGVEFVTEERYGMTYDWHPDGFGFLAPRPDQPRRSVVLLGTDGSATPVLSGLPQGLEPADAVYTPDGTKILVALRANVPRN